MREEILKRWRKFREALPMATTFKRALRSEEIHDFLANQNIKWQFNLSRAPWWGGQFERMVGLTKQTLYKTIGSSTLTWAEYVDVLLDIELVLNN